MGTSKRTSGLDWREEPGVHFVPQALFDAETLNRLAVRRGYVEFCRSVTVPSPKGRV